MGKRILDWVVEHFLGSAWPYIWPIAVAIAVAVWGYVESYGPWLIVGAVWAAAGVLIILNQFKALREKPFVGDAPFDAAELEKKLTGAVLDVIGFSLQKVPLKPGQTFSFIVTDQQQRKVRVEGYRNTPIIMLSSQIVIGDKHKARLTNMGESERVEFEKRVSIQMIKLGINFDASGNPWERILLGQFCLNRRSLSDLEFAQHIMFVNRAHTMVISLFQLELDQAGKS